MTEETTHKLEISADKLKVYLSFFRPKGGEKRVPTLSEIHKILQDANISYGIRQKEIEAFLRSFAYGKRLLVAEGDPAEDGESESIEYRFPMESHVEYDQEEARIDLRKVTRLNEVQPGDELAVKHERTPPKPGMSIFGEALMGKEGKTVSWKLGKGVEESSNGACVNASIAGHATIVADRVTVLETLVFNGDVDFSVGDIDFVGNLEVKGSVKAGFTLRTKGDMTIGGSVESAKIDCGGTLHIGGFVFGQDKGEIICRGSAFIKGISRAKVNVGGDLAVSSYIMHSQIACGGAIKMLDEKSVIVGETVRAFSGIYARNVGNRIATPTKLVVGFDPARDVQLAHMRAEWRKLHERIEQAQNALARLEDPALAAKLNIRQRLQIEKLKRQLEAETPRYEVKKEEYDKLKAASDVHPKPEVVIMGIIYPGVIIALRGAQARAQDALKEARYYLTTEGEIAFEGKEATVEMRTPDAGEETP
jgi:uncharacterized protein (DUF342 family)